MPIDTMETKEAIQRISRGTIEIINLDSLKEKLLTSKKYNTPLRIKAGFDPTAPDIHLGHVVLLKKLRQFQDLGHKVFFLIGDFTAQIGDPTGRDQTRPALDRGQIEKNARSYEEQVYKILDPSRTEIVFNSAWLSRLSSQEILKLTKYSTVAQMLARADFKKRFSQQKEISLLEFIYPLLQGYDSIYLKTDIELGGFDQKFNLLMGRQLQEAYGYAPQVVIMTPLLEGIDGVQKMSKSLNNYIGINESPDEIFGKVMSISDGVMYRYFEVLTDADLNEIRAAHPKEAKLKLAHEIVKQFHGEESANIAKIIFEKVFSQRQNPEDIIEYPLNDKMMIQTFSEILIEKEMVRSKKELQRLILAGAVSHEGKKIGDINWVPNKGIVKIGKRRFLKFI